MRAIAIRPNFFRHTSCKRTPHVGRDPCRPLGSGQQLTKPACSHKKIWIPGGAAGMPPEQDCKQDRDTYHGVDLSALRGATALLLRSAFLCGVILGLTTFLPHAFSINQDTPQTHRLRSRRHQPVAAAVDSQSAPASGMLLALLFLILMNSARKIASQADENKTSASPTGASGGTTLVENNSVADDVSHCQETVAQGANFVILQSSDADKEPAAASINSAAVALAVANIVANSQAGQALARREHSPSSAFSFGSFDPTAPRRRRKIAGPPDSAGSSTRPSPSSVSTSSNPSISSASTSSSPSRSSASTYSIPSKSSASTYSNPSTSSTPTSSIPSTSSASLSSNSRTGTPAAFSNPSTSSVSTSSIPSSSSASTSSDSRTSTPAASSNPSTSSASTSSKSSTSTPSTSSISSTSTVSTSSIPSSSSVSTPSIPSTSPTSASTNPSTSPTSASTNPSTSPTSASTNPSTSPTSASTNPSSSSAPIGTPSPRIADTHEHIGYGARKEVGTSSSASTSTSVDLGTSSHAMDRSNPFRVEGGESLSSRPPKLSIKDRVAAARAAAAQARVAAASARAASDRTADRARAIHRDFEEKLSVTPMSAKKRKATPWSWKPLSKAEKQLTAPKAPSLYQAEEKQIDGPSVQSDTLKDPAALAFAMMSIMGASKKAAGQ